AGSLQVVLSCVFWRVGPLAAGKVTRADDELSLLLLRLRRRHRHGKRQHGKSQLLVHGALSSCARAHRPFQAIQLHLSSWILDRVVSPLIILAFFLAARDLPHGLVLNQVAAGATGFCTDARNTCAFSFRPSRIPEAGLPGLILAGGGLLGWWRRRQKIA